MKFNMYNYVNKKQQLEICFKDIDSFEDALKIVNELKNKIKNISIKYLDGIWYDSWTINTENLEFELIRHDDEGIYFVANDSTNNERLKKLVYENLYKE